MDGAGGDPHHRRQHHHRLRLLADVNLQDKTAGAGPLNFDLTVTLGNIITFLGVGVGALSAYFIQRGNIASAQSDASDASAKAEAAAGLARLVRDELAEYKTAVAKEYVSKEGHRESMDQVLKAISDMGRDMRDDVKNIREQINKLYDAMISNRQ